MLGRGPIAAAATLVAACTLTSGLSDFDSEDSVPDAATSDSGDAGGSSADARDGTFDADAGADAPTTAFCAGPSTATSTIYCEDFETKPELVWEPETVGASSIVRLAARPGGGAGNALESLVLAEAPQYRKASWKRALAAPEIDRFRFSYGLWIEQRPPVGEYEVAIMALSSGGVMCEFYLAIQSAGGAVGEQRCPSGSRKLPLGIVIPTKKWVRLAFELDLASATKTIVVSLDGAKALASDLLHVSKGIPIPRVGITYANETTISGHVFMDDVLLETLP